MYKNLTLFLNGCGEIAFPSASYLIFGPLSPLSYSQNNVLLHLQSSIKIQIWCNESLLILTSFDFRIVKYC